MNHAIPEQVLAQHTAFLGKTGSGKTSTAKLAVEQIVRDNPAARVCVLDPIKSDWWGLTSSADGQRPGLPFYILGGPRGHVALHDSAGKAIGELVATGALPLSIIDMADFAPGGVQKFFNDFAPALMKKMRGVVYLIVEEAHEFAPKERSGIGAENMAIHWAKKLATAGRSKGIRMMVLTQRTQALHNALLGSCDTMIAHRLTAPADQEPVKKWLKANVSKEIFEEVSASMSSLKTGSGWICSGEAQVAALVQFPKISTYDNSATPTGEMADLDVRTATVDTARLRAIIGDAVKQEAEDDPRTLRAEIARLTALTKSQAAAAAPTADPAAIAAAEQRGYSRGFTEAGRQASISFEALKQLAATTVRTFADSFQANVRGEQIDFNQPPPLGSPAANSPVTAPTRAPIQTPSQNLAAVRAKASPAASGDGRVSPTVRKILDVIHRSNPVALSFDAASLRAGVSRRSSAYRAYREQVEASPEVVQRGDGRFASASGFSEPVGPGIDPIEEFAAKLPPSYARMLRSIAAAARPVTKEQIAAMADISPTSSGLGAGLSELIALSLIERDETRFAYAIHRDLRT